MKQLKTRMVCELGLNHLGDVARAQRMIDSLKSHHVMYVTFQAISDLNALTRNKDAIAWLQKFGLSAAIMKSGIIEYAAGLGLTVGAAIAKPRDVGDLVSAGVGFFKILSADLSYDALISEACSTGLPVYLSTGAAEMDEISRAVDIGLRSAPRVDLRLIHTVLVVPTPPEQLNLRNIQTLQSTFHLPVAYGQHSNTDLALALAVALGVESIFVYVAEQFDPSLPDGPNAIACSRLEDVIDSLRSAEEMLGQPERVLSQQDVKTRSLVRRSAVANRNIPMGDTIKPEDIAFKRPGTGIEPWNAATLIGRIANRNIMEDEDVVLSDTSSAGMGDASCGLH